MTSDAGAAQALTELLQIMRRLRDSDVGCPWDRQQDHGSIARYAIEEACELVDAIERNDAKDLCAELGDLLFQVVFHAQMASEAGVFDFQDVAAGICNKLTRRHPHVFGDESIETADHQASAWESHKEAERHANDRTGTLDGVPLTLPALTRAGKLQKRAARIGFDWDVVSGVLAKVREELDELQAEIGHARPREIEAEFGDLLFTCVNLARKLDIDPETALRGANRKFERRFAGMESLATARSKRLAELRVDQLDTLWEEVKSSGL